MSYKTLGPYIHCCQWQRERRINEPLLKVRSSLIGLFGDAFATVYSWVVHNLATIRIRRLNN